MSQGRDVANDFQQAFALHRQGQFAAAAGLYQAIIRQQPDHFDALHLLGLVEYQQGNFADAVRYIGRAIELDPGYAPAYSNLGNALRALAQFDAALASLDRAVALRPDYVEAHFNRGNVLLDLRRFDEALGVFDRALALAPGDGDTLYNRAETLMALGRFDDALVTYDGLLTQQPDNPDLLCNRANALFQLRRINEAFVSYDRALVLAPDVARLHYNRSHALLELGDAAAALPGLTRALALKPDDADALYDSGQALFRLKRYAEAGGSFERLVSLHPDHRYARGEILHAAASCCDWRDYDRRREATVDTVAAGKLAAEPFAFLALSDSPAAVLRCTEAYARQEHPTAARPLWNGQRYRHDRIRLAYVSADFHEHAVAYLIAGLFEAHDRSRFEVTLISLGPDEGDAMRARISRSADRFVDAWQMTDRQAAEIINRFEADIAVDLMAYTYGSRPGIFACRPAPLQVNYLGYPGTTGAPYIDYILADRIVIPEDERQFYTEQVIYLPDAYQVNDAKRQIAEHIPSRKEAGLPASGFVFCAFHTNYKITPAVFDVWMSLLRQVEGSVLWLLEDSDVTVANLRREAEARGVTPSRVVFAPRVPLPQHLARHRIADISLDTLPYNAHTTASDALWTGLPIVTCRGNAFAGRVAASLLHAVGLPELVTTNLADYAALALKLAREPAMLAAVKRKLALSRDSCALFDTDRTRRAIEAAYETMWERCQRGESPAGFAVPPQD
ncbi:MAG TPA: tetratricopeptide repeat protein [Stellaceae bacterium]|jgi:protein O-GlcNAc transferase|nr:tetratricopeptide repeat protein [Stellaceae bacterium]